MTAKEAAIEMIRPYVLRGDGYDYIRSGQMGSYNSDYHATIGGWHGGKSYPNTKLTVTELGGKPVFEVFDLKQLILEINVGVQQQLL